LQNDARTEKMEIFIIERRGGFQTHLYDIFIPGMWHDIDK